MRSLSIFGLLFAVATATPIAEPSIEGIEHLTALSREKRYIAGDTSNDLAGPCKAVTVIFARGTTETGNVGTLVGPPFFTALNAELGISNVAVQGVNYPADLAGFFAGGSPAGAATLASLTNQAASKCPNTKIVLSGYSQGAQVVHLGAKQLSPAVSNRVAAVVLFGDPDDGQPVGSIPASKIKTFCDPTDQICDGKAIVGASHLAYGVDAIPAANFVKSKV
ncbi:MAG: hypothetical protein Q9227_005625 [Pyrenula ochraceoflavens]